MKLSRLLSIHTKCLMLCLYLVGYSSATAQALLPYLDNSPWNQFGVPDPVVSEGSTIPVDGSPLLSAYQAQRKNLTAFGGFAVKGYGTLFSDSASTVPYLDYPRSVATDDAPLVAELRGSIIGRPLTVFKISYNFGEVIPPPQHKENDVLVENYYLEQPLNSRLVTTVVVTDGVAAAPEVRYAESLDKDGVTTTTNGNVVTTVTIGNNPEFYWSKHAKKVYATQPGNITVVWRESASTDTKTEVYTISSSPAQEERTIYWTENGSKGPTVEIPSGQVNEVNIVYNSLVPETVRVPDQPWQEGVVDYTETDPEKQRYKTFYYSNNLVHAYNVQGRVFVEYLGNPRADGTREQKGIEIVNIVKDAIPVLKTVDIGETLNHTPEFDESDQPVTLEAKVLAGLGINGPAYIHQQVAANGNDITLYAVRETQPGILNDAKTLDNTVLVHWLESATLGIKWPKQYIGYIQQWPLDPGKYSVFARPDAGAPGGVEASIATAVQLDSSNNPVLVYQDDLSSEQAIKTPSNQFYTILTSENATNRALIRYTRVNEVWFERVFSQLDPYHKNTSLVEQDVDVDGEIKLGFGGVSNVVVIGEAERQYVEGVDYILDASSGIVRFITPTTSARVSFTAEGLPFTHARAVVDVEVGSRIEPDLNAFDASAYGEDNPVFVGYVHPKSGDAYDISAYKNPFSHGFDEAATGSIIGVNALADNDTIEVWWYKKSEPATENITGVYWPSFVQKYKLNWPDAPAEIILASNKGSGELSSLESQGSIYYQNDPEQAGYNPNEEHALMLNGRAWALRDDLNLTPDDGVSWTSSPPYVLLSFSDADQRPSMKVFKVLREKGDEIFRYNAVAGKIMQAPMPLPFLPAPVLENGSVASFEVVGDMGNFDLAAKLDDEDSSFAHYAKFTWADRKGAVWLYRGPHGGNEVDPAPTLKMRYFYPTMDGFDFPGVATQPAIGTIVPYLREKPASGPYPLPNVDEDPTTAPVTWQDQPFEITYVPSWPDHAPTLRVGETLTLAKVGLPQVRGQQSAELIYQQSVATDNSSGRDMVDRTKSARLFDPTRAKIFMLGDAASGDLAEIPGSVNTSPYNGKTYFPNLPPHLSTRLYFDPAVGERGGLIFIGKYMDELFGEKYLQLNVMSAQDLADAQGLVPDGADGKAEWDAAIVGLSTSMETFVEDPGKKGTFIVDRGTSDVAKDISRFYTDSNGNRKYIPLGTSPERVPADIAPGELAEVWHSDTAVDSYAVSASGGGRGYVVMAVGNGRNADITSKDGPVSLELFKVESPLYRGELKVLASSNPLDEKLTLQHTGDFAGHPEEYDFEWRYAPPVEGLPLKLYSYARKSIVAGNNDEWSFLANPSNDLLDPSNGYEKYRNSSADVSALTLVVPEQELTIHDGEGTSDHGSVLPHALLRRTFTVTDVPLRLFMSLDMQANDGADIYINGAKVVSWQSPHNENSTTGTVPATAPAFNPLTHVFEISPNVLNLNNGGVNVITAELYTSDDAGSITTFNLRLEGSEEVENLTGWLPLTAEGDTPSAVSSQNVDANPVTSGIVAVQGKNRHTIQGSSILTLSDNYVIMRYRARDENHAAYRADGGWSKWTEPQLAEGWIKRVLAGINPFQQRIKDLFNHETNTSVSLVEQAGKRSEGNIALNLDNINESGLIEIYETVLNRGKDLSINGNPQIDYGGANDALLLAAGYLSDLYMILGNEAYADATNSTIAFNTNTADNFVAEYGDVATALYAFKGQLASVLEEELSLLRGRDDFLLPGTQNAPVYNRLVWNYTRGIDAGEAIYALNYNIKDRVWDYSINANNPSELPADGVISAADAAIAYPQGHGDAYGHYLTAITGYYNLLNNAYFTWTPRIEAVLVLGKPVSVDYQDERKFASAAAALVRTASETLDLTYRQHYSASDHSTWSHLIDGKQNTNTGRVRHWGTDEWASRAGQGALFHWVTANSLLPAVDAEHSGIQKIDRTTVPELAEIAAQAAKIQQTLDQADSHINPLGLGDGALAFDISPTEVDSGKTHYEQIFERATVALQNAVDAFDNAKGTTQFLRQQEDTLENQRNAIEAQERSFTNRLIEIYGTPYTDDIGPGKTYKQGYDGPDLYHSMLVDLPELFDSGNLVEGGTTSFQLIESAVLNGFGTDSDENQLVLDNSNGVITYELDSEGRFTKPASWTGRRVSPGRMQTAISNQIIARSNLIKALNDYERLAVRMEDKVTLYNSAMQTRTDLLAYGAANGVANASFTASLEALNLATAQSIAVRQLVKDVTDGISEGVPKSVGLANDATFAVRAAAFAAKATKTALGSAVQAGIAVSITGIKVAQELVNSAYRSNVSLTNWKHEHRQLHTELESSLSDLLAGTAEIDAALRAYDQSQRDLYALQAEGDRVQQERLVFRQHSAAIVQGYRTRDFAFRAFRDEALERYKALFDLSARYTYLAASAYDYETGLLDSQDNASAAAFYEKVVQARALGVVNNGVPQFAGSDTGDPGLSGVLAELSGDWSVVKNRLGFNNPDNYATTFSLRQENYRIVPGADGDLPWKDKLKSYTMSNILDDPDVRRYCMQVGDENGEAISGIVIPFSTTITTGYNFFGKPLAGGDHTFTPSSYSTKIRSSGIAFEGYIGMDSPTTTSGVLEDVGASSPASVSTGFADSNALSATPYIYLIPAGADSMRSPPLGDTSRVRTWRVQDQAIPLPFNIANSDYSTQSAWVTASSLSESPFTLRKHQAFRAVPGGTNFSSADGFTNSRLIGRSAWNSQWKIVIPGNTLLSDPNVGIETFINTVKDIKLHLQTYSYSGN